MDKQLRNKGFTDEPIDYCRINLKQNVSVFDRNNIFKEYDEKQKKVYDNIMKNLPYVENFLSKYKLTLEQECKKLNQLDITDRNEADILYMIEVKKQEIDFINTLLT